MAASRRSRSSAARACRHRRWSHVLLRRRSPSAPDARAQEDDPPDLTATPLDTRPRRLDRQQVADAAGWPRPTRRCSAAPTPRRSTSSSSSTTTRSPPTRRRRTASAPPARRSPGEPLTRQSRRPSRRTTATSPSRRTPFVDRARRAPCPSAQVGAVAAHRLRRRRRRRSRPTRSPTCWRSPASSPSSSDTLRPAAHRLEPRVHRRRPTLYPQLGGNAERRRRASSSASSTPASWPEHPSFADHGNLGAPPPTADGTPRACNFGDNPLTPADRPVRLQQQADRRPAVPRHLQRRRSAPRSYPDTRPRHQRPRHAHRHRPRPATSLDSATGLRRRPRPDQRHRPRRLGHRSYKVCGIEGCFQLRLRRRRRAGDPRRRRRHQLLDLRRHQPVHRPGRAGLPRRLRRRRVRRRLGRQRRPGRRHGQPPVAVGHHRRRLDPDPRVRSRR